MQLQSLVIFISLNGVVSLTVVTGGNVIDVTLGLWLFFVSSYRMYFRFYIDRWNSLKNLYV